MIRDKITRLRRRPRSSGELGRLLDAYPGPGASLTFSFDGRWCVWLAGSCCAPIEPDGPTPRFDAEAVLADAEAAGLRRDQLVDALARIDEPAHRAVLDRAAGRPVVLPSPAALARTAARAVWPRLVVKPAPLPRQWWFEVLAPDGRTLAPLPDSAAPVVYPTQQAALEVGLAHLAVVSASWALDVLGATLPPGYERIVPA